MPNRCVAGYIISAAGECKTCGAKPGDTCGRIWEALDRMERDRDYWRNRAAEFAIERDRLAAALSEPRIESAAGSAMGEGGE